jgi:hypothetical protein
MFTSGDKSVWNEISASRLCSIPVWKGNRILDDQHVKRISDDLKSIESLNSDIFKVFIIQEDDGLKRYLYDGQHRQAIIKNYFSSNYESKDFIVIVSEKLCLNESEAIELFKRSNATKSMQWKEDPMLVANNYVELLCREFNRDPKRLLIRSGKTNKPYLSSDRIREVLVQRHVEIWKTTPQEFVIRCREINDEQLTTIDSSSLSNKRAKELKFSLGVLDFSWI